MNTPRRAAHRLFFHVGHVDLCPDCMAVLAKEGEVAGDPREPAVTLTGHRRTEPAPLGVACDTCASLEAYEEALGHALTTAVHEDLTVGRLTCDDADFGTPEEHARWHANHDTPTLAELEGNDAPSDRPYPSSDYTFAELWDADIL